MNLIEKLTVQHFHEHRIQDFGVNSVEALGWRNKASQEKRFEVLAQIGDLSNSSVLDMGCGYGGLKLFLDEHFQDFTYVGVDQIHEFIVNASNKFSAYDKTYFVEADFSKLFFADIDYIIGSGAFGYRCERKEYYLETIIHMFQNAKKGIAFNMLDDQLFPKNELIKAHNKTEIKTFCEGLSKKVKIVDGYLKDDFTVFVWK